MDQRDQRKNQFVKGWNFGNIQVHQDYIELDCLDQPWMNIQYNNISNINLPAQNDIEIEFNHEEADDIHNNNDILCGIRFYVPQIQPDEDPDNTAMQDENEQSTKINADGLKEQILKFTKNGTIAEALAVVPKVHMITPRGKFDVHMMKDHLKIHGPSHDYKISFKNIMKVYLLPRHDGIHIDFIVALDKPLRQGNTVYPFLVFQCRKDTEETIELNLPEELNEREAILKEPLDNTLNGHLYDIMARLFRAFIGVGIIIPGNFKNSKGLSSVKCNLKASDGYLFPLEKSILFVHKPVVCINLETISYVEFSRVNESSMQRSFDLTIFTNKDTYEFLNFDKQEYDVISKYIAVKKIKVKSKSGAIKTQNIEMDQPITSTKVRKAPEVEIELPSDDEDYDYDASGDDQSNGSADDDEESERSERKKEKKHKKHKKEKKHKKRKEGRD